jgi:hypothetical protein
MASIRTWCRMGGATCSRHARRARPPEELHEELTAIIRPAAYNSARGT